MDSLAEVWDVEINEKTDRAPTELQVREKLRSVQWKQFFHRLQFNDDAVLDQEIDSVSGFKLQSFVNHRQSNLVLKLQASDGEFVNKASGVGAFQQSRSKSCVDVQGCVNDSLGDIRMKHDVFTSMSSVSSVVEIVRKQDGCPSSLT
jgi:hypothetical protein